MAEIVGIALAAPGVIDAILRCAKSVYDKIDAFNHTDATTAKCVWSYTTTRPGLKRVIVMDGSDLLF